MTDNLKAGTPEPSARSLVDRIRKEHDKRDPTYDLSIPRWDGNVVARYRRISKPALLAASRAKRAEATNARLLVAACEEVFIRDESGRLIPAREADGLPGEIKFDGRLADLFGLRAETPELIVRAMYADDVALGAQATRLLNWQTGADLDDASLEEVDDLAGEDAAISP